ncbi:MULTISPECIES: acetate/propionate family kinase [unclassified Mesorhizobium]|uniref:acetate/propionate family kinase n=1 Tax=unclassified Mesorhizobium TaxID=325217 RepID=UPI000FC9F46B|nr:MULTISPECIES: acetate/propionate family kinase [unclassified Mesorhizobium]RVD19465.1 acetate/propionate family kinase [Mesorhizobium sp. M7A.F.Ca.ET.027.02.1.1]RVD65682.1 acetate/propionate family kinase [Mesorhizobium sp. M7A.F.Ca.ET.027.03.2.1]RWD11705.1 MAG: acetate/propionate family kinase [Mesorhizobium sp.]RWP12211.1 MAG: acetate/propionate family kinase [Mesorhizobium sp.]RWP85795.1 MAG: acetate/propionate family kinase [Mesorhizobium sp.]
MMRQSILALNAGSSSIKFALYDLVSSQALQLVSRGTLDLGDIPTLRAKAADGTVQCDRQLATDRPRDAAIGEMLNWVQGEIGERNLLCAGHRIVHGGSEFIEPVRLTPDIIDAIDRLTPLVPLHQPRSLAPVRAIAALQPDLPQVGCFDTAFHQTIDPLVRRFALPRQYEGQGLRRYGFHGLSYEYIAGRLSGISPTLAAKRTIVAHLGNGASLCALQQGKSIDTTMGFSALDGLVMGTRCGAIDPGVLLYFLLERGIAAEELQTMLYEKSGLLGVSGISGDMRTLEASNDPRAQEAMALFAFRAAKEAAALANTMGGLECLVFTAGIGERSASIRKAICEKLTWLGVVLEERANDIHAEIISRPESKVEVRVIATNEESVVARHSRKVMQA